MNLYSTISEPFFRVENDPNVIANLLRKGWLEVPEPVYDPETQRVYWASHEWKIEEISQEELAAQSRKIWANTQEFMEEFTVGEKFQIANSTDSNLVYLRFTLANWTSRVFSDHPDVLTAMALLQGLGIIDEARKNEILS